MLTNHTVPVSQSDARDQHRFESLFKSITQKGNALLGLGKFDEAKECYESLRELGENSTADQYLKKLHDIKEKDIRCFGRFLVYVNSADKLELYNRKISQNKFPKQTTKSCKKKKQKK